MRVLYSCDSHVVEPPEVFAGLEEKFGTKAPVLQKGDSGGVTAVVMGGIRVPVGRFGIAGHRVDDPATLALIEQGYDGMNPGVLDPVARLVEQAEDGISGEVMYPSINMLTFSLRDRDVVHEVFRRHNNWIRDYCSEDPNRLVGIACIPMPDVDAAVDELHRVAKLGLRGIAIPCSDPADKPYHHPDYEPFWSAAEEAGLPISMHFLTGATWDMGLPASWGLPSTGIMGYTLAHSAIAVTMGHLICGGVAERHPGLQFISAEFDAAWVGHFLWRLDHATYRARSEAAPDLTMQPSEYFRRQFFVTFEDDAIGVQTRGHIGVDNLLWGNDYPHHDSIWPRSREVVERIFEGVPDDEVDRIVAGNVMKLYGVDAAVVAAG